MLMFWTGHQRDAGAVLTEQRANTERKLENLVRMRTHAQELQQLLSNGPVEPRDVGRLLHDGWQLKRELASTVTTDQIDAWYERALKAGADGGKLCGAGGGGCIVFVVPPERQDAVRQVLSDLIEVPISYEVHGSRVLLPPGD
jgi:D-glycero-alpha-D-manno-heptose-7-phosphate kinase